MRSLVVISRVVIGGFASSFLAVFFSTLTDKIIFPSPTIVGMTVSLTPASLNCISVPPPSASVL